MPTLFSKFRTMAIFVISNLETDPFVSCLIYLPNFTCRTPAVHQLSLSPERHSRWNLQAPQFELQDLIRRCKHLDRKKGKTKEKGLYRNGHNWRTHVMRRSGIEHITPWRSVRDFGARGLPPSDRKLKKMFAWPPCCYLTRYKNLIVTKITNLCQAWHFTRFQIEKQVSLVSLALQNLRVRNVTVIARSLGSLVMPQCPCQLCISASCCIRPSPFLEKVFQSHAPANTSLLLHSTIPLHKNPRITQLLLCTISILILRIVLLGSRTGVYEVSVLQEYDAASLGHWFPIADTYLRAGNINLKNLLPEICFIASFFFLQCHLLKEGSRLENKVKL